MPQPITKKLKLFKTVLALLPLRQELPNNCHPPPPPLKMHPEGSGQSSRLPTVIQRLHYYFTCRGRQCAKMHMLTKRKLIKKWAKIDSDPQSKWATSLSLCSSYQLSCGGTYLKKKKKIKGLFTTQVKVPVVVFCLNLYIPSNVKANWLNMTALVLQTQAGVFASVL